MIVGKAEQVLSGIEAPLLRAELAVQAVGNLVHVGAVETGVEALVALIVGDAVAGVRVHPAVIVPVEGLPHQHKLRLQPLGKTAQLPQKCLIQAVGHVQPQPVDAVVGHPAPDGVKNMVHHIRIVQIQLDQLLTALPALIPEAVVIAGVPVKGQVEPIPVGAVPSAPPHVLKGPEPPAHMVEHSVKEHPNARGVEGGADLSQILPVPEAAVHPVVVPGVVAVGVALKEGVEEHAVRPQPFDMLHPVQHPEDPMRLHPIVLQGRAAQPQGINLIDHRVLKPHRNCSSLLFKSS